MNWQPNWTFRHRNNKLLALGIGADKNIATYAHSGSTSDDDLIKMQLTPWIGRMVNTFASSHPSNFNSAINRENKCQSNVNMLKVSGELGWKVESWK